MLLSTYVSQVRRLLHDPNAQLFSTSDLESYINEARLQIAVESMSVRALLNFPTVIGTKSYSLTGITTGMPSGGDYILVVRKSARTTALSTQERLDSRPWDWFFNYCICDSSANTGVPTIWSQLGLGSNGNLYLHPTPDAVEQITVDCVIVPNELASDLDPEILAYPWINTVKYYAAYLAYMNAQRNADADRMYQLYQLNMTKNSAQVTPDTLPRNFPLSPKISGVPSSTVVPFPGGSGNA
jgi:hypothetical protein